MAAQQFESRFDFTTSAAYPRPLRVVRPPRTWRSVLCRLPPLMKMRQRGPATAAMYVIDAGHYLDDNDEIAPKRGPARKLAELVKLG